MQMRILISLLCVLGLLVCLMGCGNDRDVTKEMQDYYDSYQTTRTKNTSTTTRLPSEISNVKGQKLAVIGDSITYGYGLLQAEKRWYQYVEERYGFSDVYASAEIGRAFTRNGMVSTRFTESITQLPQDADVIIVFGGVNDYNFSAPIGSIKDTKSNADNGITFYAALKYTAEMLKETYPDAQIIFMTPLPCNQHQKGADERNVAGHCVDDYVEAIRTICDHYGFDVVDLNRCLGFEVENLRWLEDNMPDGLHPNNQGVQAYVYNGIFPALDILFEYDLK